MKLTEEKGKKLFTSIIKQFSSVQKAFKKIGTI